MEKMPKPKCKKPSKQPNVMWTITEKQVSTTRGKPGKAPEAQQRKVRDVSKQVKTGPPHSLEDAEAPRGKVSSPKPKERRSKDTAALTGLTCRRPDNTKCSKSSTSDRPGRKSESRGTCRPSHIQEPKLTDVKPKSLAGEAKIKSVRCTKSTVTDLFPGTSTLISDQQASGRNFRFHTTDSADMSDFSSSPPPPPPSSTPLVASCSAAPPNNPTSGDDVPPGRGLQPGGR